MEEINKNFHNQLKDLEISFDDQKLSNLYDYFVMIEKSSKEFNLTSLKGWSNISNELFIRSLRYIIFLKNDFSNINYKFLDVGTGAGIPSIPIKIFYPEIRLSLCEPSLKGELQNNAMTKGCNLLARTNFLIKSAENPLLNFFFLRNIIINFRYSL